MTPGSNVTLSRTLLTIAALLLLPLGSGDGFGWRTPAALAETAGSEEKDAFEAAKALGTVEAWDAFLSNYPKGFHADLARAYVKKLAAPTAAQPAAPAASLPPPAQSAVQLQPAQELSCKDAQSLRSERSTEAAKVRFVNDTGAVRVIQWIDFNGSLKEYAELQPGQEFEQETFVTHPWIAAYQEGSCSQVFMPGHGTSVARLKAGDSEPQVKSRASEAPATTKKKESSYVEQLEKDKRACDRKGGEWDGRRCRPKGYFDKPKVKPKPKVKTDKNGFEIKPWTKPGCASWQAACKAGDNGACGKYESTCQVN